LYDTDVKALLSETADRANRYLASVHDRPVFPPPDAVEALATLGGPVPEVGSAPSETIRLLDEVGSPATTASAGPRYFGFVVGGALPVSVAANWLATAWDQNAPISFLSPVGAALEATSVGWLVDLLGLPDGTWGGLVSGATMANMTGLAAARHAQLEQLGWDVNGQGLFGAPELRVVVSEEVHVSVLLALRHLGLGRDRLIRVATDAQGRMRPDSLPELDNSTIVCIQAGNINSGAFDPATEICEMANEAGAWVHVDGAFGLWAAAAPDRAHLAAGFDRADSWAVDAHKWLNVPYDSGIVLCRHPKHLAAAGALDPASYIEEGLGDGQPDTFTPQMSRRARGVDIWAVLHTLGRQGVADMIERTCRHATRFAEGFQAAGHEILNDVVINQVLVSFGDDETTQKVLADVQDDGTAFMSGTTWKGRKAMRISVSSWATEDEDVQLSVEAINRIASRHK
jgi:glutamate/tyrosine decarboxylase-like PLP-dependent enzyme